MADLKRSDFCVAFTMILCRPNFYVQYVMKLIFTSSLEMASLSLNLSLKINTTSKIEVIDVGINLSAQSIMVSTTYIKVKCPLVRQWSGIFSVMVYLTTV